METQDDSIDIVQLQRVALGLDLAPSQLLLDELETIDSPPPRVPDDNTRENNQTSDFDRSSTKREVVRKLLARSIPREEHAAVPLNDRKRLSGSKDAPESPLPVGHTAKMGSVDGVPSDTQVVSQSVFDDMIRQNKDAARNASDSNIVERATLMTLREGDSGHIDLLSGFENTCPGIDTAEDNEEQNSSKLGESSPMRYQPDLFPESQRFLTSTPATAFKLGQSERSNSETPCVSKNPLASDIQSSGGIMALSQVFRATQAPSSPLVYGQQPDLMSDRPSPNLPIQSHPLATVLSSPLNALAATFPQDRSETPMGYISMKESQARRDRILQERMTRSAEHIYAEDQSDGEFEKEPSFVERIIRQRAINQEASAQFAGVAALARASSRRRAGEETTSPSSKLKQRDQADPVKSTTSLADRHKIDTASQSGVIREAETEHGGNLAQSQPTQQAPSLSTEEDKENCNANSLHCLPITASAHDRLSPALSLHDNSVRQENFQLSRSPDRQANEPKAISETVVVKDSQQSPRQEDHGQQDNIITNSPWHHSERPRSRVRYHDDPSDRDRVISSPTRPLALRSSPPPPECELDQVLHPAHLNFATTRSRSSSASCHDSSSQLPRDASSAQAVATTQSSNPASRKAKGAEPKSATVDPREKSSSMPSRVAETPVPQRPRSFGDVIPTTSIPETSPNTLHNPSWADDVNNDPMDKEDDDLPPAYPTEQGRVSHSQPLVPESSTPARPFSPAKILSSPSGRQRRALTEIAADASPQAGTALVDEDIGILTADDKEFSSVVSASPIPPRKKRRGIRQNVYASDPILPFTPRIGFQYAQCQNGEKIAGQSLQTEEFVDKTESSFIKRSRSSKRMGTVWEVEDTPQYHVSRKEMLKKLPRPRAEADSGPHPLEPAQNMNEDAEEREGLCEGSLEVPQDKREKIKDMTPEPMRCDDSDLVSPLHGDKSPIALNQVIAPWSGQKRAYYPATCVGKPPGISQSRVLVKFEDSVPIEVPIGAVKRLELKIGDAVKVDMPNVPKVTHIIRGFEDRVSAEDLTKAASDGVLPVTDVYGYTTLLLGPKQRKSLPAGGLTGPDNLIKVPVARIYLDTILWNQLKDRAFTYSLEATYSESRLQTPSDRYTTPASPGSRLPRSIRFLNGIFAGMVFALSYGDNDEAKSRITKMILDNDGSILKDGFNELFELPWHAPLTTPTKSPAPGANCDNDQFRLAANAEEVGFACLIADKHSRRPKYMQALALNIPCLSDRWIEDCIAKNRILDWEIYLLPSGESIYLNGATKSRYLAPYPATTARLPDTIAARPNLLKDQSVLLVMGRGGRSDEERRKAYIFLTYALGASRVERVPDLKSARASLDQQAAAGTGCTWDWIYVDGDEMASAKAAILGSSMSGTVKSQSFKGTKKRKRSELVESIDGSDIGLSTSVKIVGNEFVCQSLILGRLFGQ
jgi:DNA repair protein RAD9